MKNNISYVYSCGCSVDLGILASKIADKFRDIKAAVPINLPDRFSDDKEFIKNAGSAYMNIAIDGCDLGCAHRYLKSKKIEHIKFFLTDFGYEKGKTEVNEKLVSSLFEEIRSKIGEQRA